MNAYHKAMAVHPTVVVKMSEKQLNRHFGKLARYSPDAPQQPYSVRFAGKFMCSHDTMDLYKKFQKAVKEFKPPNLIHMFEWKYGKAKCRHCDTPFTEQKREKPCPTRMKEAGYGKQSRVRKAS